MIDPQVPFSPLGCRVHDAADIRAILGANVGDPIGGADMVAPGDTYALRGGARTYLLALCPTGSGPGGAHRLAAGTEIGRPGDTIHLAARLTLMDPDGQPLDLLILRHEDPASAVAGTYVLPMAPIAAQTEYTLIRAEADPGAVPLADVICASFVAGTRITLADGSQRAIERLAPGDRLLTRDHGAQTLRWNGTVTLRALGAFAPVVIPAGVMGNHGALILSQNHRLFRYHRLLSQPARIPEVLVQARRFLGRGGIHLREGGFVTYHALIFDRHEIIYAEGIPAESLLVDDATLGHLPTDLTDELRARFPGLSQSQHFGQEVAKAPPLPRFGRGA